jgi:hypothetical protein
MSASSFLLFSTSLNCVSVSSKVYSFVVSVSLIILCLLCCVCCVVFAHLYSGFIPWRVSVQIDRKQPVLLCTDEAVSNLMKKEYQKTATR